MSNLTPRLLTPYAWAKEAGCSHTAVSNRIRRQELATITLNKHDGQPQVYIDANLFPPHANPVGTPVRRHKS